MLDNFAANKHRQDKNRPGKQPLSIVDKTETFSTQIVVGTDLENKKKRIEHIVGVFGSKSGPENC